MESFRILRKIGQGGNGRAYLVESLEDKKLKVVKQINLNKLSSKGKKEAIREIKMMMELKHFNIIRYRSHVIQNDILSILMDYADGGDFDTLIKQRSGKAWSEDIIIDYFVQMCLAIKYLHDRKIVHRDIKPSNFFVCKNGIIKLGDFGLSHLLPDTEAMLRTQAGTPYYLSPELCKGEPYNQKTDIWSLGCVLYEMCMLKRPFRGKTMNDVIMKITQNPTPAIQKYYDLDLQALSRSLLSKDPESRPSINEILETPFIKYKAIALLGQTQAKIELSHTIFHGLPPGMTPEDFPSEIFYADEFYDLKNELQNTFGQHNNNVSDDQYEFVDFMGFPMRLPHVKKTDSAQKKADNLREFIITLVGFEKFNDIYTNIAEKKVKYVHLKYMMKKDICIAKLVQKLLIYESLASKFKRKEEIEEKPSDTKIPE